MAILEIFVEVAHLAWAVGEEAIKTGAKIVKTSAEIALRETLRKK